MNFLRTAGAVALIALAGGTGYIIGTRKISQTLPGKENENHEILIEISYSGGMLDDYNKAVGSKRIRSNGEIETETRGGEITNRGAMSQGELEKLISKIDTTDFSTIFKKKDERFCKSWVDGVDAIYSFTTENTNEVFDMCNYKMDGEGAQNSQVMMTIFNTFDTSDSE